MRLWQLILMASTAILVSVTACSCQHAKTEPVTTRQENIDYIKANKHLLMEPVASDETSDISADTATRNGSVEARSEDRLVKRLTGSYKSGVREGIWTELFLSGQTKTTTTYRAGLWHGPLSEFYENGQKKRAGTYKLGFREGLSFTYGENGEYELKENYRAGFLNGKSIEISGGSLWETTYRKGQEIGATIGRNALTGKKIREIAQTSINFSLENNRVVTLAYNVGDDRRFDPNSGNLTAVENVTLAPHLLSDDSITYTEKFTEYHPNGKIAATGASVCWIPLKDNIDFYFAGSNNDEKCSLDRVAERFSEGGTKLQSGQYDQGRSVGEHQAYWPNGEIKSVTHFNQDGAVEGG